MDVSDPIPTDPGALQPSAAVEESGSPETPSGRVFHLGTSVCTLGLAVAWGDFIDVIGCAALWCVLPRLSRRVCVRSAGWGLASGLLWFTGHATILGALDRVHGYPDKELSPLLMGATWGLVWIAIVALLIAFRTQWRSALLCGAMIALPIVEGPILLTRHITAGIVLIEPSAASQPSALYTTRLGWRHGIQVGRRVDAQGRTTRSAMVYTRDGLQYRYQRSKHLLDGRGSMDAQRPNLPLVLNFWFRDPS
jgi:hypothetical protein